MSEITEAEWIFCMYKLRLEGSFMTSLIETIFKADIYNQANLAKGFPELVKVIQRYSSESGYWDNLVNRWNAEYPHRLLNI